MCRAVEEEKVVLRVHGFRPDVKNVVRERREVKRCITEESDVPRSSLSPPASSRGSWVFFFETPNETNGSFDEVRSAPLDPDAKTVTLHHDRQEPLPDNHETPPSGTGRRASATPEAAKAGGAGATVEGNG